MSSIMFNALRSSCELLGQVIGELYGTECKLLETASKETVINSNYSYYDILVSPACPYRGRSLNSVVAGASLWVSGPGGRLRCPECGREMKNEHSLSVHISRYHNDKCAPTKALCPVCRKVYSNQYSLRTHMHLQAAQHNTQHTQISPVFCSE